MWIRRFSSVTEASMRRFVSDKEVLRLFAGGVKDINRGIILPPLAVTLIMALLVPLGPVTRTKPVGKDFSVVLPVNETKLIKLGVSIFRPISSFLSNH